MNDRKYYHGTSVLFDSFDLDHALEGDGKVKFGYGIYLTESYDQAALYAGKSAKRKTEPTGNYVYTVYGPWPEDDTFISLIPGVAVHPSIVERAVEKLGEEIPAEVAAEGKFFRKYIANLVSGNRTTLKKMISSASILAEKAASEFFKSIGVKMYVWPVVWKKPNYALNVAVLDEHDINILQIEQVELNEKGKLVYGSMERVK